MLVVNAKQDGIVTIGMTSYNYGHYIGEAVESVVNQTSQKWRLVIYDNCSTDDTLEVLERYLDNPKITLIVNDENIGSQNNISQATRNADTEFYSNLQADDFLDSTFVENALLQFQQHPSVPFVFFNWHQYMDDSKTSHYHDRFPFMQDRSGPIRIGPFLSICNFVPLHMAVFKTESFQKKCEQVFVSPLKQVGEQFLLKLLEDEYGVGCYSGTMGGMWRRHDEQLTIIQVQNGIALIDEPVERSWYLRNATHQDSANAFMALVTWLRMSTQVDFFTVADWLLHSSEGQQYAESFNIPIESERYRLQSVVLVVMLKFSAFSSMKLYKQDDLQRWVKSMGYPLTEGDLQELLMSIMSLEGETLINEDEIKQICEYNFKSGVQVKDEELALARVEDKLSKREQAWLTLTRKMMMDTDTSISAAVTAFFSCIKNEKEQEAYLALVTRSILDNEDSPFPIKVTKDDCKQILQLLITYQNKSNSSILQALQNELKSYIEKIDYATWVKNHGLREIDAEIIAEQMTLKWQVHPILHCILFLLPGEESLLADTIDSLATQLYSTWHLTVIAETESPDPIFENVDNLHWKVLGEKEFSYDVLNQEISKINTGWTAFIEPGTRFEAHALAKIVEYINLYPQWSFIYTDDDLVDREGERSSPRFKPDFNLDLLRSSSYIGEGWMQTSNLLTLGGVPPLPGAENYDIALRWADEYSESAIGHIADVLINRPKEGDRPFDSNAGMVALEQHLARKSINASVQQGYTENSYRVEYHHETQPRVTIIIPTKDKLEYFQPCIESVLETTTYPNFDIIVVDNQSTDSDTLAYYDALVEQYAEKVTICFYDKPFNFAAMNNMAAEKATGDYLLMLNNDTEIVQGAWLDRMMSHGQRDDIGIVGARLVYPTTGKIQHVGIILGLGVVANHPYVGELNLKDIGYMGRTQLDQNFSAVTAAVLLIKKQIYQTVNGMDAEYLAVNFNDVDLCIRVNNLGYKVLWTPYATVVHHGSASMKGKWESQFYADFNVEADRHTRSREEYKVMLKRWLPKLANDPAYNKNLTLTDTNFSVELNGLQNWDVNIHTRQRCFGVPLSGGSGHFRIKQPFNILSQQGLAQCEFGKTHLSIIELERLKPDAYVFQNIMKEQDIELLQLIGEFQPNIFRVYSLDDLINDIPEKSSAHRTWKSSYRDTKTRLRKSLKYCDRLVVSTQPLADLCAEMIEDIRVIPNRLEGAVWSNLESKRQQGEKPRVGWAGAQQHQGDLEIIFDVVKATADEIDWIFMGMCPDELKPVIKEFHDFISISEYPEKLASLNLDLAIAPLELHPFNEAKSNLRILEYGILGWPVICSDITPYRSYDAPVIRVSNDTEAWVEAIQQALSSTKTLQDSGDKLRQWVLDEFILEDHIQEWQDAFNLMR